MQPDATCKTCGKAFFYLSMPYCSVGCQIEAGPEPDEEIEPVQRPKIRRVKVKRQAPRTPYE